MIGLMNGNYQQYIYMCGCYWFVDWIEPIHRLRYPWRFSFTNITPKLYTQAHNFNTPPPNCDDSLPSFTPTNNFGHVVISAITCKLHPAEVSAGEITRILISTPSGRQRLEMSAYKHHRKVHAFCTWEAFCGIPRGVDTPFGVCFCVIRQGWYWEWVVCKVAPVSFNIIIQIPVIRLSWVRKLLR